MSNDTQSIEKELEQINYLASQVSGLESWAASQLSELATDDNTTPTHLDRIKHIHYVIGIAVSFTESNVEKLEALRQKTNSIGAYILSPDEARFLESYEKCDEEGRRYIKRLCLLARNGVDIKKELARKGLPT